MEGFMGADCLMTHEAATGDGHPPDEQFQDLTLAGGMLHPCVARCAARGARSRERSARRAGRT